MNSEKLSQAQFNLIIGCLLGNANMQTENGHSWRIRFVHKAVHEPYIRHKYKILKEFCNTEPKYCSYFDERTKNTYSRFQFNTLFSDKFEFLGNMFYKKKDGVWIKVVPTNIKKFLTPESLSYWYMDDGALKWKGRSNSVRLCTDSFSEHEVKRLKLALEKNFNLKCSIQKKNGFCRIAILEQSYLQLKELIVPFLLPCMYYKFPDGKTSVLNSEDISNDIRNTFEGKNI